MEAAWRASRSGGQADCRPDPPVSPFSVKEARAGPADGTVVTALAPAEPDPPDHFSRAVLAVSGRAHASACREGILRGSCLVKIGSPCPRLSGRPAGNALAALAGNQAAGGIRTGSVPPAARRLVRPSPWRGLPVARDTAPDAVARLTSRNQAAAAEPLPIRPARPVLRVSTGVGTRQHAAAGAAVWHRRGKPSALPRNQWLRVPVGAPVLRGAWRLGGGISQDLLAQPTHAAPDPLLALPGSGSRRMALGWIAPASTEGLDSCTCQISAAAGSYRCVWIWSVRSGWCWQTGSGGGSTRVGQGRGRLDARATLSRRPKPARRGRAAGGCAGAGSCPEPVPDGTPAVLTGR